MYNIHYNILKLGHLKLNKTYLLLQPFLMSVSNTLSKAALRWGKVFAFHIIPTGNIQICWCYVKLFTRLNNNQSFGPWRNIQAVICISILFRSCGWKCLSTSPALGSRARNCSICCWGFHGYSSFAACGSSCLWWPTDILCSTPPPNRNNGVWHQITTVHLQYEWILMRLLILCFVLTPMTPRRINST